MLLVSVNSDDRVLHQHFRLRFGVIAGLANFFEGLGVGLRHSFGGVDHENPEEHNKLGEDSDVATVNVTCQYSDGVCDSLARRHQMMTLDAHTRMMSDKLLECGWHVPLEGEQQRRDCEQATRSAVDEPIYPEQYEKEEEAREDDRRSKVLRERCTAYGRRIFCRIFVRHTELDDSQVLRVAVRVG